jgi:hypothetical protein
LVLAGRGSRGGEGRGRQVDLERRSVPGLAVDLDVAAVLGRRRQLPAAASLLPKPFTARQLLDKVREALDARP